MVESHSVVAAAVTASGCIVTGGRIRQKKTKELWEERRPRLSTSRWQTGRGTGKPKRGKGGQHLPVAVWSRGGSARKRYRERADAQQRGPKQSRTESPHVQLRYGCLTDIYLDAAVRMLSSTEPRGVLSSSIYTAVKGAVSGSEDGGCENNSRARRLMPGGGSRLRAPNTRCRAVGARCGTVAGLCGLVPGVFGWLWSLAVPAGSRAVVVVALLSGAVSPGPLGLVEGQPCGEWPSSGNFGRQGGIFLILHGSGIFCPTRRLSAVSFVVVGRCLPSFPAQWRSLPSLRTFRPGCHPLAVISLWRWWNKAPHQRFRGLRRIEVHLLQCR